MTTKNPTPLEGAEQRALFAWAKLNERSHPELALLHAIPNGGKRNPREAANLKAQGVKAGVPDICLPVPRGGCASLYIELKRRQGGRPTQAQLDWMDALKAEGNAVALCYGADAAMTEILRYLEDNHDA